MAKKEIDYFPSGVCSSEIHIILNDNIIESVSFVGGCNGNTQGVAVLLKGMTKEEAIKKLKGICCGSKRTSCPDQLARALEMN